MEIVVLMESPRKPADTDLLVDEMIKWAQEKGFNVNNNYIWYLEVRPCKGCNVCIQGNDCVFKDGGFKITHEMAEVEGLIVASHIYFD